MLKLFGLIIVFLNNTLALANKPLLKITWKKPSGPERDILLRLCF